MTLEEMREVANISTGTVAQALGTGNYEEIDRFMRWLFRPVNGGCKDRPPPSPPQVGPN